MKIESRLAGKILSKYKIILCGKFMVKMREFTHVYTNCSKKGEMRMKKLVIFLSFLLMLFMGCGHVGVTPEVTDAWQFDFSGDVTWTLYARIIDNAISEKDLKSDIKQSTHGPGSFHVDYMKARVEDGLLQGEIKGFAIVEGGASPVKISFSGKISDTEGQGEWSAERIIGPAYGDWRCIALH